MIGVWFRAFVLTVVIESVLAVPLLRHDEPKLWRRFSAVGFAQLISHPAVWFIFPALGLSYEAALGLSEAWAFGIEALFYIAFFPSSSRLRLVGVSLVANGASWGIGALLQTYTSLLR